MEKIDFKKQFDEFYKASSKAPSLVKVPAFNYLMVDGQGNPNTTKEYAQAVEALFSLSYAIKFFVKKSELQIDYGVMPLEGLWWATDMKAFKVDDKSQWQWTMMIMQPSIVTKKMVAQLRAEVAAKKELPALEKIRFESYKEGECAQILHVGPFTEEGPTVERLHEFILQNGNLTGKHHEIYLSDIRRAAPEKWKTIVRQPMSR